MKRERIVRVMRVVHTDSNGQPTQVPGDFWDLVLNDVKNDTVDTAPECFHNGHKYIGIAPHGTPILYIAKDRTGGDLPSEWTPAGAAPLNRPIHEPLFLLPVPDTPAVAALGTSGAATPTAVGRWLTSFYGLAKHGESFELHPVFLGNTEQRMRAALGATSLDISVRVDEYEPRSESPVEEAIMVAARASSELATARIKLSMGPGNHGPGSSELRDGGISVLGNPAVTSGKVRARVPDDEGTIRSELIDLVNHRFTHRVKTSGSDEALSIATALPALEETVHEFQNTGECAAMRRESAVR